MFDKVQIVEITAGRHGMYGTRNSSLVPLGGLVTLRNATLEDKTWRTGPGAATFGSAPAASAVKAAIDYFADGATQRTLVALADGSLRKDDGAGGGWVVLKSGLTVAGRVPMWSIAGAESSGRNRKAFYCDRINAPQVLAGDGLVTANISTPNADWAGANQPGWMNPHQGYNWAGGVGNNPHIVYRSLATDHEDYATTPRRYAVGPLPKQQLAVGGMSYKGGQLVFCYPVGVYWIDTSGATDTNWFATLVAYPGCAGPRAFTGFEDDVLWVDPLGGWHVISATNAQGSLRATDITHRKLGRFPSENTAIDLLAHADLIYDADRPKAMLAYGRNGSVQKDRRLDLDLTSQAEVGENWVTHDRDVNECLFLRAVNGVETPTIGDAAGQLWTLERVNRNKANAGYTFEWFMRDTDFSQVLPQWGGRKKNLVFLQIEFDPRGSGTHTVEVWRDGKLKQTLTFTMASGSGIVFGDAASDTFDQGVFGGDNLQNTAFRKLKGAATRIALRGYSSGVNEDISVAKLRLGLTRAA